MESERSFQPPARPGLRGSSSDQTRGRTRVASDARLPLLLKSPVPGLDQDLGLALDLVQAASPTMAQLLDLLVLSPSTTWESSTTDVPPSMEIPLLGAPHRLMPTTTMLVELVPGDIVTLLALTKRLESLDLDLAQPLDQALDQPAQDPALGLPALLCPALLRDLLASSPSPSWESLTSAVPPSMETPLPGAQPRLMPTTTMSLESAPGDTVMPLALFKRLLPPQQLLLLPQLLQDLSSLLPQELASAG